MSDADQIRRLRAARGTGKVPADLLPWLLELAAKESPEPAAAHSPFERLAVAISKEIDLWMTRRGVSHRTIGCPRRSLVRILKGENVTIDTLADVADSLGCDVMVSLQPRKTAEVAPLRPQLAPLRQPRTDWP